MCFATLCPVDGSAADPQPPEIPGQAAKLAADHALFEEWGPPGAEGGRIEAESTIIMHTFTKSSLAEVFDFYGAKCGFDQRFSPSIRHYVAHATEGVGNRAQAAVTELPGGQFLCTIHIRRRSSPAVTVVIHRSGDITAVSISKY